MTIDDGILISPLDPAEVTAAALSGCGMHLDYLHVGWPRVEMVDGELVMKRPVVRKRRCFGDFHGLVLNLDYLGSFNVTAGYYDSTHRKCDLMTDREGVTRLKFS